MRISLFILLLWLIPIVGSAQQLSTYRYWYDNDFSNARHINFSDSVLDLNLNVIGLSEGLHQINCQFRDTARLWSSVITQIFYRVNAFANQLKGYRYWYDNDFSNAQYVTSSDTCLSFLLNVSAIDKGFHQVNFQFLDATSMWSSVVTHHFYKTIVRNPSISQFRYWFDDDLINTTVLNIGNITNDDFFARINLEKLSDGTHRFHYQFSDDGNLWSSVSTDTITRGPISSLLHEYPEIFLQKALIQQGQTDSIWGKKFSANGQVKITVRRESLQSIIRDTNVYADYQGKISLNYYFISSLPSGTYSIEATDQNIFLSSYIIRLKVLGNITSHQNLIVTAPLNISKKVDQPVKISWSDIPGRVAQLIPNTASVNVAYRIEYNKENTGWQLITTYTARKFFNQPADCRYDYLPAQTGKYQFRVTDMYNTLNTATSGTVSVTNDIAGAQITYGWDYSGNRLQTDPIGVAADGTSRIYVRISKKAGNNKSISSVNISVRDSLYPSIFSTLLLGKLVKADILNQYSTEANKASSTTAISSTLANGTVWFWYVAPDDFLRNNDDYYSSGRDLNLVAKIVYSDNTSESVSNTIEIVRPPLMLVHGLGGNESTWDDFFYEKSYPGHFKYSPLWKFKGAINMYPGGSFAQNSGLLLNLNRYGEFNLVRDINENYDPNSFQYFLQNMRNRGFASNRVDYVCHSMGGAVGRTVINFDAAKYMPSESSNTKFKNYSKGFINKLITLNTPHNGSPWADAIISLSNYRPFQILMEGIAKYDIGGKALLVRSVYNTDPNTGELDFSNPKEALINLQYGYGGIKFKTSTVKNHLIAGDIINEASLCNSTLKSASLLMPDNIFIKILRLKNLNTCERIDEFFNKFGVLNFWTDGDIVVPLNSQLPGKNIGLSGVNYTIEYGLNAWHTNINNSDDNLPIGTKVLELLNAPVNSNLFADSIVANPSPGNLSYRTDIQNKILDISEHIDTGKIVITNPVRMFSTFIDSNLNISIRLKDTAHYKYTTLLFQGEIYNSSSKINMQTFSVQVNPHFPNNQTIVATAVYDSSGSDVYYTDTLSIFVKKDSVTLGFFVNPEIKFLNNGEKYCPGYSSIHKNYIANISIRDTALYIMVADTSVVSYLTNEKLFLAKDSGTTYAIISYNSFKDTVFFYISDTTSRFETVTGVNDTTLRNGIPVKIYPNPVLNGIAVIDIQSPGYYNYQVQFIDVTGRIIYSDAFRKTGHIVKDYRLKDPAQGIIFVAFYANGKLIETKKLVYLKR
jgi:pimeloyl-ACP methyl ester carboxylesterase